MIVKNIKIVQYSRKYFYKKTFCECKKKIYIYMGLDLNIN